MKIENGEGVEVSVAILSLLVLAPVGKQAREMIENEERRRREMMSEKLKTALKRVWAFYS